jgi:GDP-L-fucose synthase
MLDKSKILITGSTGMLGSSVLRLLKDEGYTNLLHPSRIELDLRETHSVNSYFELNRPEYVFLIAAKVGGIYANMTYRADFIFDNLMMQLNVINACKEFNIKKILFVSSGCIYPKNANNPISESDMLTGLLEPSNEHYSIAKIAGIKTCEAFQMQYGLDYAVVIPNNIYGPGDNYHPENSHVMASLIKKFHQAKSENSDVEIWGSGNQMREFVYVDDVASSCILLMKSDHNGLYNCSSEVEISIKDLANTLSNLLGFTGKIIYNTNKPEGHFRKGFSCEKLKKIGWVPKVNMEEGVLKAYDWYKNKLKQIQ